MELRQELMEKLRVLLVFFDPASIQALLMEVKVLYHTYSVEIQNNFFKNNAWIFRINYV